MNILPGKHVHPTRARETFRWRLKILGWLLAMPLLIGLLYAFNLQVCLPDEFLRVATKQHLDSMVPLPGRGRIFDCQGRALALSRSYYKVQIYPRQLRREKNEARAAAILDSFSRQDSLEIRDSIVKRPGLYTFLPSLSYESGLRLKRVLRDSQLDNSINVELVRTRLYPYGDTLGSVIGVAVNDSGKSGMEASLNDVLRGEPGIVFLQKDGLGNRYRYPDYPEVQPLSGHDVRLTIDLDLQRIAYEEMQVCVDSFMADGGSAIVIDCRTGAVKAICDYPYLSPSRAHKAPAQPSYYCRAAEVSWEPGSCWKPTLGLAALDAANGARLRNLSFDVSAGFIEISGYRIKDVHNCGVQDFPGIFIQSSNVGLSKLSMMVERRDYYRTMRRLGFGQLTGIELPHEDPGMLDPEYRVAPDKMSILRVANNSFGQGCRATLLQLAVGYEAIANDGWLKRPYLVQEVRAGEAAVFTNRPLVVRRAVSVYAAREMKNILARVVTEGTGKSAASPLFAACGKTGTAEKAVPGLGYKSGQVIASFVGFYPKDDPEYVVAVSVDNPRRGRFAGTIVGPTFRRISERCYELTRTPATPDSRALAAKGSR